ncbi:DUF1540 domain-containing protein [Paenibacillus naphthalenovorans]|uniref:DUF1540 domain-containing protein n=1 Tax=Paenibacillus naphthalenovorans TaxID=162209 RepID=UPI00349E9ED0
MTFLKFTCKAAECAYNDGKHGCKLSQVDIWEGGSCSDYECRDDKEGGHAERGASLGFRHPIGD